jgi:exopolyphosphatase / guanosine-5'-triphosphate,3'-diphosphate pyrophosphatase
MGATDMAEQPVDTRMYAAKTNSTITLAAVDIGSNTIKLTVATQAADGTLVELHHDAETVRLGAGIAERGALDPTRIERALECLTRFSDAARQLGALHLCGVATEAIRRASDGAAFVERVEQETGWSIAIISGDEEARLAFAGLQDLVRDDARSLIADIGGGSTELIWTCLSVLHLARSVPIGSGRLSDQWMKHDPPTVTEVQSCRSFVLDQLLTDPHVLRSGRTDATRLLISGGTGVYLGLLVGERESVEESQVHEALSMLTTYPAEELAIRLHIPLERAKVLPAGVAIVSALCEAIGSPRVFVTESGIRRGLLLEEFARLNREGPISQPR